MRNCSLFFLLSFFFFLLSLSHSTIIRVPTDTSSIQGGIYLAHNADTVLVADGIYYENINFKGKHITVASHFLLDMDTCHIVNTIINGSQSNHPDTGSVVLMISGEDTTSILCGLTITGGSGTLFNMEGNTYRTGGGVACGPGGARVIHNKIMFNEIIRDCAAGGAGISVGPADLYEDRAAEYVIIEYNRIGFNHVLGNLETKQGGGILWSGEGRIRFNKIDNNECYSLMDLASGGGIQLVSSPDGPNPLCLIEGNIISNNRSRSDGTYVYAGGLVSAYHPLHVVNNIFEHNRTESISPNVSFGGGLNLGFVTRGTVIIEENRFSYNTAIYGGGLFFVQSCPVFINNTVAMNDAIWGGGICSGWYGLPGHFTNINNTIVDNTGGGVYLVDETSAFILNTVLWNNTGNQIQGNVSGATLAYCNIQGGWTGTGNIDVNPHFADSLFHLSDSSFCIGAGRRSFRVGDTTYYSPNIDLEGDPRPNPIDTLVDIGADESPYGAWAQPLNTIINNNSSYIHPTLDSLKIGMNLFNLHQQEVSIHTLIYTGLGCLWDEVQLFDDGLHGDSAAGDLFYGAVLPLVMMEERFCFDHRIDFLSTNQSLVLQEAMQLTSIGPLICEDFHLLSQNNNRILLQLVIRNQGQQATATGVRAELVPINTAAVHMVNALASFGDIPAGATAMNSSPYILDLYWNPGTIDFDVIICSDGYPYWHSRNLLVGIEPSIGPEATEFTLHQNFPNPFNPSTVFSWQLAVGSNVRLAIYDLTGREVAVLVNEEQRAGRHQVIFDAADLSSGIYLYRLKAGNFVRCRKMLLIK